VVLHEFETESCFYRSAKFFAKKNLNCLATIKKQTLFFRIIIKQFKNFSHKISQISKTTLTSLQRTTIFFIMHRTTIQKI